MQHEVSARPAARRGFLASLACAAALLFVGLAGLFPGQAAGAATHCVHANTGGTICNYGGLNTYAGDTPGTGFTIWQAAFWNYSSGTQKSINRVSYCCAGEWYSSSVKTWDQNMPDRTTDLIDHYDDQPGAINVVAFWKHT